MNFSTSLGALISRVRSSNLFRDAFWIFVFNITSKGLLFFGMANAARCLGPVSLGISAQVQVLSQQLALSFNGGIDSIGMRNIAADSKVALPTFVHAVSFRLGAALLLSVAWIVVVVCTFEPSSIRSAWLLGAPLLIIASLNTAFIYQAIGKLPVYSAITSAGTIAIAAIYLLWFRPGIAVGADLSVTVAISGLATLAALVGCKRLLTIAAPVATVPRAFDRRAIRSLLRQGWRFWLLALVVYLYAGFPILLVSYFQGDAAAGVFRAALLMASAIELLFSSINSLLLPKLVTWNRGGARHMWSRQMQLVRWHVAIGVTAGIISVAVSPFIFERFLGSAFNGSVIPFQILVAGRVVVFIGQIYAFGLVALQLDSRFLRATLLGTALSLTANLAVVPHAGAIGAAAVSVLVEVAICSQYYFIERRHVLAAT